MNEVLRNNAILHLAKHILASIFSIILLLMFMMAGSGNHYLLAFVVFVLYTIVIGISLIQLILFVKKMIKTNKK